MTNAGKAFVSSSHVFHEKNLGSLYEIGQKWQKR